MLKGLNPLLGPDLLATLREMGHGDEIVIADANFPAATIGRRVIRLDGVSATDALQAVLSVLPIDRFENEAVFSMAVVGGSGETPDVVREFQRILTSNGGDDRPTTPLERFAFYDRARNAFAVVATGETRLYGNLIVKKGIIETSP